MTVQRYAAMLLSGMSVRTVCRHAISQIRAPARSSLRAAACPGWSEAPLGSGANM